MSDDLISRKVVMDYLREQQAMIIIEKNKNNSVSNHYIPEIQESIQTFMNFIVQVPTAYDVDKVINELEHAKEVTPRLSARATYKDAIEVVKGGGV